MWVIDFYAIAAKKGGDKSVSIPSFKVYSEIYCQPEAEKTIFVNAV